MTLPAVNISACVSFEMAHCFKRRCKPHRTEARYQAAAAATGAWYHILSHCMRRPMRAQLALRCPKLSVMLRAPPGAGPFRAATPVFEASLQQVCGVLAAGSQAGEQLQSGAGPLTIEVSQTCPSCCVRFTV